MQNFLAYTFLTLGSIAAALYIASHIGNAVFMAHMLGYL